jgi:hypothetical protein
VPKRRSAKSSVLKERASIRTEPNLRAGMKDYAASAAAISRLEKGGVFAAQLKRLSEKYNI